MSTTRKSIITCLSVLCLVIVVVLLLASCNSDSHPTVQVAAATETLASTAVATASTTPSATAPTATAAPTESPAPTVTATPTLTPTPPPTPTFIPLPVHQVTPITALNANELKRIGRIGYPALGYSGASVVDNILLVGSKYGFSLYEVDTLRPLYTVESLDSITSVALHPTDELIVSGSNKGEVIVWDRTTGEFLYQLKPPDDDFSSGLVFVPGTELLIISSGSGASVWDFDKREFVRPLTSWLARAVAVSPDGSMVATGNRSGSVDVWDFDTGDKIRALVMPSATGFGAIAFSPDGRMLAKSMEGTNQVVVFNLETGDPIIVIDCQTPAHEISFTSDSQWLLVSADAPYLWQTTGTAEPHRLALDDRRFYGWWNTWATFIKDEQQILYLTQDGFVKWSVETGEVLQTQPSGALAAHDIKMDANNNVTLLTNSRVLRLDATTMTLSEAVSLPNLYGEVAAESMAVAWAGADTIGVVTWEGQEAGTQFTVSSGDDFSVDGIGISPDGTLLAAFARGNGATRATGTISPQPGHLRLWNLEANTLLFAHVLPGEILEDATIRPQNDMVAAGGGRQVSLWYANGRLAATLPAPDSFFSQTIVTVEFSPNGALLAIGCWDGDVYLYSLESQVLTKVVSGPGEGLAWARDAVTDLAFSPDGTLLAASVGHQHRVDLIDWRQGAILATLDGGNAFMQSVAFSANATLLAASDREGFLYFWGITVE